MTGPLLPPVLAARKLVSDPDGSVSNNRMPDVVVPSDQEGRSERPHAAELGVLLLVVADLAHEQLHRHRLGVGDAVDLSGQACVIDQDPSVRTSPAVAQAMFSSIWWIFSRLAASASFGFGIRRSAMSARPPL